MSKPLIPPHIIPPAYFNILGLTIGLSRKKDVLKMLQDKNVDLCSEEKTAYNRLEVKNPNGTEITAALSFTFADLPSMEIRFIFYREILSEYWITLVLPDNRSFDDICGHLTELFRTPMDRQEPCGDARCDNNVRRAQWGDTFYQAGLEQDLGSNDLYLTVYDCSLIGLYLAENELIDNQYCGPCRDSDSIDSQVDFSEKTKWIRPFGLLIGKSTRKDVNRLLSHYNLKSIDSKIDRMLFKISPMTSDLMAITVHKTRTLPWLLKSEKTTFTFFQNRLFAIAMILPPTLENDVENLGDRFDRNFGTYNSWRLLPKTSVLNWDCNHLRFSLRFTKKPQLLIFDQEIKWLAQCAGRIRPFLVPLVEDTSSSIIPSDAGPAAKYFLKNHLILHGIPPEMIVEDVLPSHEKGFIFE